MVRELRLAILANGYPPLAVHTPWSLSAAPNNRGKQPVGAKWQLGHSVKRLMRINPLSANTGILLGGTAALVALDIDPHKKAPAAEQRRFMLDVLRLLYNDRLSLQLRAAPQRLRSPGSALLLLRASTSMTKIAPAGERGKVELLGEGQQFVCHGWHPLSRGGPPVFWGWSRGRAPGTVPMGELPVIPVEDLTALMGRIAASGLLGPPVVRAANTATVVGRHGRRVAMYPATARLKELLAKHNDLVKPAVRELIAEVGKAGHGRHDALVAICGRLAYQKWPHEHTVDWLTPIVNEHFHDDDWTVEVEKALAHAQGRERARFAKVKTVVWSN